MPQAPWTLVRITAQEGRAVIPFGHQGKETEQDCGNVPLLSTGEGKFSGFTNISKDRNMSDGGGGGAGGPLPEA